MCYIFVDNKQLQNPWKFEPREIKCYYEVNYEVKLIQLLITKLVESTHRW